MEPNEYPSMIPQPSPESSGPETDTNQTSDEVLKKLIAIAKTADPSNLNPDKLVQDGKRIQKGKCTTPGNIQAFKLFYQAAYSGHPEAQYLISRYYDFELGVEIDRAEFLHWLLKSAGSGFAAAQNRLGVEIDTENKIEAAKWFEIAAKQNDTNAMLNLGQTARNEGNQAEAVGWYRKAAELGSSWGQYILGTFYSNGEGVDQDDQQAAKWWTKAAGQGEERAQSKLGTCYATGRGVPSDDAEAVKWWTKAAARGARGVFYQLGIYYASGRGVPKDNIEAYKYLRIAARESFDETINKKIEKEAAELERLMSSSEVEEGLRLCRIFRDQERIRQPQWMAELMKDETWRPLN